MGLKNAVNVKRLSRLMSFMQAPRKKADITRIVKNARESELAHKKGNIKDLGQKKNLIMSWSTGSSGNIGPGNGTNTLRFISEVKRESAIIF